MNYYILKPKESINRTVSPWYNVCNVVIEYYIQAFDERDARIMAAKDSGEEGVDVWLSPDYTNCREVDYVTDGDRSKIILRNVREEI